MVQDLGWISIVAWILTGLLAKPIKLIIAYNFVCQTYIAAQPSRVPSQSGSNPFVEIDHEIISTVILLPSADLFKKGCCQLQAKVCARITA